MIQSDDSRSRRDLSRFVREAMRAPLLTREHEFALARAWRDRRDEAAKQELVAAYTRLVVAVATRFRHYGLPLADLVQEGSIGLLQAADRFDPDREVRFSTYATWWVRSAIQDFVLRNWSIVRTGTTSAQKALFFNLRRLRARIEDQSGEGLDPAGRQEIADSLHVSLRDVEAMEARLAAVDQSLNSTLGEEGDDELISLLPDDRPDPEGNAITEVDGGSRSRWISEALDSLSERERNIVLARRLTDEGATLEELGRELGVSKERVRQIESRALNKMRASLLQHVASPEELLGN